MSRNGDKVMATANQSGDRRTSVDEVFEYLQKEIRSLSLRPGDKISEAEVASRFGVSRQPVRDAFSRLASLDLLLIRPQRATVVKRFSSRDIIKSRFVRAAVEKEVLKRAAENCDAQSGERLDASLAVQEGVIRQKDMSAFGTLDYEFHKMLCEIAQADFAFDVIMSEKSKVDRLCMLSLSKEDRMPQLVEDHIEIAAAVKANDAERAMEVGMLHLSRLDETIEQISATNANYFEPATD